MTRLALRAIAASMALLLGGCAAVQSTEEVVLDYNRAFANSRNEMLVLNILRSAAREPMQFSTMGNVSGQIGNSTQLTIPFTNVIAGGRDIISPSLQINDAVNPQINIVPLGAREFVTGILTPLGTDDIQLFLHGAWDAEFLLPLVIGGVVCPDGRFLNNRGTYGSRGHGRAEIEAFRTFFAESAPTFRIQNADGPGQLRILTLTDQETADLLREGLGTSYAIDSIEDAGRGRKRVRIRSARQAVIAGLKINELCRAIPDRRRPEERARASPAASQGFATPQGGRVLLRSVQTIIYFLGETHRERLEPGAHEPRGFIYLGPVTSDGTRDEQILFRLQAGSSAAPHTVEVQFQGTRYFIPRFSLGSIEAEPRDRTLKTLSFLDQLIALQTAESTIRSTQPILVSPQ